ncbi:hypothetical protein N0V84_010517 [Fusarium piperis]|uniref:Uncharacterized protein n=1 Tax=Fusarium piperis TaxID=1435070 RepID=A0A9W8W450_9HYPO|nr:hypothetical protein N0V84_010517 [Fusarium piperis]
MLISPLIKQANMKIYHDPVTPKIIDENANQPVTHETIGLQASLASSAAQWYCPPEDGHML